MLVLRPVELTDLPQLQQLARDSLVGVYYKLWEHGGTKGDLESFLGPVN